MDMALYKSIIIIIILFFFQKKFRPGHPGLSVLMKNSFNPVAENPEISVSGNWAGPPSHMNTSKF